MTLMMIVIYPEARMTVPFSAITKIGGEFVLKQRSFILVTVFLTVMIITSLWLLWSSWPLICDHHRRKPQLHKKYVFREREMFCSLFRYQRHFKPHLIIVIMSRTCDDNEVPLVCRNAGRREDLIFLSNQEDAYVKRKAKHPIFLLTLILDWEKLKWLGKDWKWIIDHIGGGEKATWDGVKCFDNWLAEFFLLRVNSSMRSTAHNPPGMILVTSLDWMHGSIILLPLTIARWLHLYCPSCR